MIAKEDLKKNEILFRIPRNLLLDPPHGCLSKELREYEMWLQSIGRTYVVITYGNTLSDNEQCRTKFKINKFRHFCPFCPVKQPEDASFCGHNFVRHCFVR